MNVDIGNHLITKQHSLNSARKKNKVSREFCDDFTRKNIHFFYVFKTHIMWKKNLCISIYEYIYRKVNTNSYVHL